MVKAVRMSEAELEAYLARRKGEPGAAETGQAHAVGPNLNRGAAPASQRSGSRHSLLEDRFEQQILEHAEPEWPLHIREYFFLDNRDFRFDFAWPGLKVAVEIQGMSHRIKGKFKADIEKRALALLSGWRVLELDGERVRNGQGIKWLKEVLWQAANVSGV